MAAGDHGHASRAAGGPALGIASVNVPEAQDSKSMLHGWMRSVAESREAERVAWLAPGVQAS